MKEEFTSYLESLGITTPILERVESVLSWYSNVVGEEIKDLFVSDYINEEQTRVYEGLFLFSSQSIVEARQFVSNDSYDYTPLPQSVAYWEMRRKDFDLKAAAEKSRLFVSVRLHGSALNDLMADFKASGKNCDRLLELFKQYFAPQIRRAG
jgi:hypothetical protein